jgi:hypothetical protein
VLRELTAALEDLTRLSREKLAAVRRDDLDELNRVLNREQALSLAVRGLEQKRLADGGEHQLSRLSLDSLPGQYPEGLQAEARATVKKLRQQYELYNGVAGAVRTALECGLHEIEKALDEAGAQPADQELPVRLRTDIHA